MSAGGDRLSVALFTYSTLPRGSVVHTASLADALVAAGCDTTVYALDKNGTGFFRPLRARLRLVPAGPAPASTAELVQQRACELADALLRDRARAGAHDVHHAEDCLSASGLLAARERGLSLRLVRTVHHVEDFQDPYLAACQTRSIREADLCLTVSQKARADVYQSFGRAIANEDVVGNGVDLARFAAASGDSARLRAWRARRAGGWPVVLTMGGVEPRKNTLRTLKAFARVRNRHPRARLWIAGGATVLDHHLYRQHFDQAYSALDTATRAAVSELGVIDDADVPALLRAADVLAMPSTHEGFGLCALEALAAGVPVVVSNGPPFTEFLDASCATLVDPLSDESIAEGLTTAVSSDRPARPLAGQRRAALHSWERVAQRHIHSYERILADAGDALRRSLA